MVGVVTQIMDSGLVMTILCLDEGKSRDIDNLKISVRCALLVQIAHAHLALYGTC